MIEGIKGQGHAEQRSAEAYRLLATIARLLNACAASCGLHFAPGHA
jgi:hypothetical protein